MTAMNSPARILVPVAVLEGETVSEALVALLSDVDVTLLGYHVVPDQTTTDQAHDQFHARLKRTLDAYAERFEAHGGSVRTRSVFTHDATTTFERIALDEGANAILLVNPTPAVHRILVALRSGVNVDQIVRLTAAVGFAGDADIVLFHAAPSDTTAGEAVLADAAQQLRAAGIDPERIHTETQVTASPVRAVAAAAEDSDFVIIGEQKPSLLDRIFGDVATRIATVSLSAVLVVRKPAEADH